MYEIFEQIIDISTKTEIITFKFVEVQNVSHRIFKLCKSSFFVKSDKIIVRYICHSKLNIFQTYKSIKTSSKI